jgi:predicted transcriptional regulator of viral defense system
VSHDSALLVHELCDINPTNVHITIPHEYRIGKAGAERYDIHRAVLGSNDTIRVGPVVVTTVFRTLADSLATVPAYLMRHAIGTARSNGSIRRADGQRLLRALDDLVSS